VTSSKGVNDNIVIRIALVAATVIPMIISAVIKDVVGRVRR
jgi:hypothetical protein